MEIGIQIENISVPLKPTNYIFCKLSHIEITSV